MSFRARNNKIAVTDMSGHEVFSTDRKMFAVLNRIEGSVTIANLPANNVGTRTTVLASISSAANFVIGQVKAVSAPAGGGLPNIGTFSGGGSIVWGWYKWNYSDLKWMQGFWTIAFVAEGGQLKLVEDFYNLGSSTRAQVTLVGGTLSYKINCGTFL